MISIQAKTFISRFFASLYTQIDAVDKTKNGMLRNININDNNSSNIFHTLINPFVAL